MRVPDDYRFDGSSPVGRYWLIHGVGFTVCRQDGRKLGVVAEVVVDPVQQSPQQVVVRRTGLVLHRHETLDPGLFEEVVPGSQLFLVESPESEPAGPSHAVAKRRARSAAAAAGTGVQAVGRTTRHAGSAARPHVFALLHTVAAAVVLGARATRKGAIAFGRGVAGDAARVQREWPRLVAWLSVRARAARRAIRSGNRRIAAAGRVAGQTISELSVLLAMVGAAGWRRVAGIVRDATAKDGPAKPETVVEPDDGDGDADANAPLRREEVEQPDEGGRPPAASRRRGGRTRTR